MKKTLWIAIAGALAASVIAASAQEVLSANAVGYIKKTLPAGGKLVAVSMPLDSMTEANNVFGRTSLAQEMPVGSWVHFWNEVNQTWVAGQKSGKGWSPLQSNTVVKSGEGFFIQGPKAAAVDTEVTITGEVPPDATISRAILANKQLSSLANPYPVDFKFGDSDLAVQAPVGSWVHFWNQENQTWVAGQKSGKGWSPLQSNTVVQAGEGFFLQQPAAAPAAAWNAAKPYTWP